MAQVLEIGQSLAETYEPKRAFRWIIEAEGIDSFLAESVSRPKVDIEEVEARYINTVQYFAGRLTPQTIEFQLKDAIAPSQSQKIMEWVRSVCEVETGRAGYKAMYARDFRIKMLSPTNEVVESWVLKNAWPTNYNASDLNANDNSIATISVVLRYDRAILEF